LNFKSAAKALPQGSLCVLVNWTLREFRGRIASSMHTILSIMVVMGGCPRDGIDVQRWRIEVT
jgi:hypothetical protein